MNILSYIRRLPEGVRVMLALFFMLIAAGFLFNSWTAGVSSGLSPAAVSESVQNIEPQLDTAYTVNNQEEKSVSTEEVSSPLISITDSFQSFIGLFKPSLSVDGLGNFSAVKQGFDHLASNVNVFLGKAWERIHEKLQ